jgi:3-oxoacyl-[acyl-carrier-protein] synthase-3
LIGAGLSNESKIDLVIAGTSVFDHEIPSSACMIAGDLRIEALAFDVNSACSSFIADLHVARSLLATASAKRIAIFNAERYSTRVDFTDRTSCILFGDGAAATIVETDVDKPGLKVIDTIMESDPSSHGLVKIPLYSTFTQQGSAVQKFAIHKTMAITQKILARNHLTVEQVRFFVGHQANLRMVSSAASKLGFQGDQHLFNVDLFGNQGGAGAPTVLAEHWTEFRNGDYIVVSVVGSGLTWGSALFQKV